jgi:hypothetical protein
LVVAQLRHKFLQICCVASGSCGQTHTMSMSGADILALRTIIPVPQAQTLGAGPCGSLCLKRNES